MAIPESFWAMVQQVHGTAAFAPSEAYPDGAEKTYMNVLGPRGLIWARGRIRKRLAGLPPDQLTDWLELYRRYEQMSLFIVVDDAAKQHMFLNFAPVSDWTLPRRDQKEGLPQGTGPDDWTILGAVGLKFLLGVYRGGRAGRRVPGQIHIVSPASGMFADEPSVGSLAELAERLGDRPEDLLADIGYGLGEHLGHVASTVVSIEPGSGPVPPEVLKHGLR